MRSRRKEADVASAVGALGMFVVFLWFCLPQWRVVLIAGAALAPFAVVAFVFLHRASGRLTTQNTATGPSFPAFVAQPSSPAPTSFDLPTQLHAIDWFQFEKLVALTYRKLGYSVTRRGGANPDGGIDLVLTWEGQQTAVQCKQWKTWNVGVKAIREFLGALKDSGIERGIFITLQGYTDEARQLADRHGITIVNAAALAEMLADTNARLDPEVQALLCDQRKYCPKCESEMVLRTAARGSNVGQKFWGCSRYPRCRYTLQA